MRHRFFSLLLITSLIISCKKDNVSSNDFSRLIIGKWFAINHITQYYSNDTLSSTTTQQPPFEDYLEFRRDGSFASLENGVGPLIGIYKVEDDSIVFEDTRRAQIKTITESELSYYFKVKVGSNQYTVDTFKFIKR